jgi:poly-gamma-glutamate capsule biosynthesis protein CapA/YwtB (metallophosphatase superfamily)
LADRLYEINKLKFPEPGQEPNEPPIDKGLHDRLEKAGLKSSEQIEQEAAAARGEAVDSVVQRHIKSCEDNLKAQWGSQNFEENLETARLIFDYIEDEKDRSWLVHTPRNGQGVSLANDPAFIELLRQVGEVVMKHNDKFADELRWFNENWKPKRR